MGDVRVSLESKLFGRQAESAAEHYLRRKGYRIRDRNVRSVYGELDLVVERAGVVVFVEVKARRTNAFGGAPYAVDSRKQMRRIRLAAHYLAQHKLKNQSCRFDVLLCADSSTDPSAIEHIENAFEVPGHELQW
ncbi:MAG TPA: YraN family protein [Nitrospiraceae bacterium]|nr:YraN family protein [Nitrospiraceae bacterium]